MKQEYNKEYCSILYVTRNTGLCGSFCYLGFFINEELVARISNEELLLIFVKPGKLIIKADNNV